MATTTSSSSSFSETSLEVGTAQWLQETVGLYGRDVEAGKLREALDRHCPSDSKSTYTTATAAAAAGAATAGSDSELFLLAGAFGTGKSYLIESTLEQFANKQQQANPNPADSRSPTTPSTRYNNNNSNKTKSKSFLLGTGKFDQLRKRQPYSAIQAALTQVASTLLQDEDQDIVAFIVEEHMGDNAAILRDLMPVLGGVLNYTTSSGGESSELMQEGNGAGSVQDDDDDDNASSSLSSKGSNSTSSDPMQVKNRFQYVFRKFVRTVCKYKPLVLVIDDLQWADASSLGLIQAVLQDKSIKRLLVVGAYRKNNNDTDTDTDTALTNPNPIPVVDSDLEHFLQDLNVNRVRVNSIELGPLSQDDIGQMVRNCFPSVQDHSELGTVVYTKTQGNPYFAIRLLDYFVTEQILLYNKKKEKRIKSEDASNDDNDDDDDDDDNDKTKPWSWDPSKITLADIPETVEDLIVHDLQKQSSNVQTLLKIAAALGMYADEYSLNLIIRSSVYGRLQDVDATTKDSTSNFFTTPQVNMKETLREAMAKGFIVRNGKLGFKFTHDKIYQMAYKLMGDNTTQIHLEIGRLMYKNATKKAPPGNNSNNNGHRSRSTKMAFGLISAKELTHFMERQLFVAVDQMNSGQKLIIEETEVMGLLRLNIKAADHAFDSASFSSAKEYLEMAQLILDGRGENDIWASSKYYQLMLQVNTKRAQTYLSLGDWDQGDQLVETVMEHARTLDVKLPLFVSQIYALRRRDLFVESYHKANDMLLLMGEYPKRNKAMKTMGQLASINRYIKKHSDSHILGLPIMKDAEKLQAMVAMSELSNVAFMIKEMFDFILTILLRLQVSFKHGISEETAVAFAAHAITMGMFGNEDAALRCSRLAISIMQKTKSHRQRGLIVYLVTRFVNSWTLPLGDVLHAYQSAHSASMEAGSVEIGCLAWYNSNQHAFICGISIPELADSTVKNCEECELYKVESVGNAAREFASAIQRLSGALALDWSDLEIESDAMHIGRMETRWMAWLPVAVIFGNLEVGKQLAKKLAISGDTGFNALCLRDYYSGILYAKLAHRTGKRKHINVLRKHETTLTKLAKVKGSNCKSYATLLKAARIGLTQPKNTGLVQDAYEDAFQAAARKNRHQDLALGHELLGELHLKNDNATLASVHLTKACQYFRIWGASAKVAKMEAEHFRYISDSNLALEDVPQPRGLQMSISVQKPQPLSSEFLIN